MKTLFKLCCFFTILLSLQACQSESYKIEEQVPSLETRNQLLAQVIVYHYTPEKIQPEKRFDAEYRPVYAKLFDKYQWLHYHIHQDSTHYFLMATPARSARKGDQRGVGGSFRIDAQGRISHYREIFCTPVIPAEEVKEKGLKLFKEVIKTGTIEKYLRDPDYVDFPNQYYAYDTLQHQWKYRY